MKTLEERAHDYAQKMIGGSAQGGLHGTTYAMHYDTYIRIAREQRDTDVELLIQRADAFNASSKKLGLKTMIDLPSLRAILNDTL